MARSGARSAILDATFGCDHLLLLSAASIGARGKSLGQPCNRSVRCLHPGPFDPDPRLAFVDERSKLGKQDLGRGAGRSQRPDPIQPFENSRRFVHASTLHAQSRSECHEMGRMLVAFVPTFAARAPCVR